MNQPTENMLILSQEVREISGQIGTMKRQKNRATDNEEKERLCEAIKMKQYQALFYIEKMSNLNKK